MSSKLEQWLRENGLEPYGQIFSDNHIRMDMLGELSDSDLRELGMTIGHRLVFQRALERLRTGNSADAKPARFSGERKLVTVVFCDIVQSTKLSSLIDAEELDEILMTFFAQCATIVEGFGGILAAKQGDGGACWFGWPRAHEDDALRAVHAALKMVAELPEVTVPSMPHWRLDVRIGVATGHVVISATSGDEIPQIVGETPNLAERMKSACPVASVVIDPLTRRLVGAHFELADLGDQIFKGFAESIRVFKVVAPRAGVTRFEGSHPGHQAHNIVGRQGDLAMMRARWELACRNEGQVVLVTGPAGIGKSRLAAAFFEQPSGDQVRTQIYQCSHIYQNTALHPLIARIMREAEMKVADPPEQKLRKLALFLQQEQIAVEPMIDIFASLLSIPAHDGFVPVVMSSDSWRAALFRAALQAVEQLSAKGPTILVVEDIHWIDPTSLELLDALVAKSTEVPVMLLMTSRELGQAGRWSRASNFTHLQLNRLSPSQSREVCLEFIGREAAIGLDLDQIVRAAQGLPLFLEELAKYAREANVGDLGDRLRNGQTPPAHTPVPDELYSYLAERLDRLDTQTGAKRVAQTAAVFGSDFSAVLLSQVPSLKEVSDVAAAADQLIQAGLLVSSARLGGGTLSFRHAIFREVAYSTLLRTTRRTLHGEIARVLIDSGMAEAEPGVVAYHFTEALDSAEAIFYWTKAGLRANERSATAEAFSQFSKGLELVGNLPEEVATYELELPLRIGFGGAASAIEGYSAQDIEQNYSRMLALAKILCRPDESFRAHLGLGAFYEVGGDVKRSLEHCEDCLNTAELSGDRDQLLHANRLMGEVKFYEGQFETSSRHLETAIALYDADDHLRLIHALGDDPAVLAHMYNALSLWFLGFPDRAEESCRKGLALAARLSHAFSSAQADFYASWLFAFRRDYRRALHFAERAIEQSIAQQYPLVLALSRVIKGWARARMGDPAAGRADIVEGMAQIRGPRADICESSFLTFLADYHLIVDEIDEGLTVIAESRQAAGERFADTDRLRLEGELRAGQDIVSGERLLRAAMARAREQASLSMELRSALSLCRLPVSEGRSMEFRRLLAEVAGRFKEGLETADLSEARAVLAAERVVSHA